MALPALFIPTSLDASGLSPVAAERLRASWEGWWAPFREELRALPPEEGSAEERQAVARLAQHIFGMMANFGPELTQALQSGVQQSIEHLLVQAEEDVETERRLGFHWLRHALEGLGKVIDRLAFLVPVGRLDAGLADLPTTAEEIERQLDMTSILLLRLELGVFVAWDLISEGTPTEFCAWARRAATTARHLDVWLPFLFWSFPSEDGAVDLRPETMLDAHGVTTVLRLLDDAPGPNEAMLRLFRDDDPQAQEA